MTRKHLLAAAVVALAPIVARAGIQPSFSVEDLAFEATHVVVVSEGKTIDGVVDVIESWTGGLTPGTRLELADLAVFASEDERTLSTPFGDPDEGDPERVDGSRMVLFLVAEQHGDEHAAETTFRPAARWGGMRVSVAWLARGRAYGFQQLINPGDAVLTRVATDEKALRERVTAVAAERRRLAEIAAAPDTAARARDAAPFTRSANHRVQRQAFETLAGAGDAALPVLRGMLRDDERVPFHPQVIEALATAGGAGVVPDLVAIVTDETVFWRRTAPDLQRGWWNGKGLEWNDVGPLRYRYSRVLAALRALEHLRDPRCEAAVTALRDYWRSLPQLEDRSGLDQMSKTCDSVLAGCAGR